MSIYLPKRFTTLAVRRELDQWDRENFGRRSYRGHVIRTRALICWRRYQTLFNRLPPKSRKVNRLYRRARDLFLST